MQPVTRLLKLGAALLASLGYVWYAAVRRAPAVKRRKARRRKARREERARR